MTSPKDIAAESDTPMFPEQRRELMLCQLRMTDRLDSTALALSDRGSPGPNRNSLSPH